jgi:Reticulon
VYYQVNKVVFDALFNELANVTNFLVLEFQRLLFAENTAHTAAAFLISFLAYKSVRFIPLWSLTLIATTVAFSLPALYLRNKARIDKHLSDVQTLATEKASIARDLASEKVGFVSQRAKVVTSEWGKKAGVQLPWSPKKKVPEKTPADNLQGLNVPQGSPSRKVEAVVDKTAVSS